MLRRKFTRARSDPRTRRFIAANPLWPLQELYDLRDPPFVADPEFIPFDIDALRCDPKNAPASPSDVTRVWVPQRQHLRPFQKEFPTPKLVSGLPWRYASQINLPIVPEGEFPPLDLSCISPNFGRKLASR